MRKFLALLLFFVTLDMFCQVKSSYYQKAYDEKGPPLSEAAPLCGGVNKFLTDFEDLKAVYLFGKQEIE